MILFLEHFFQNMESLRIQSLDLPTQNLFHTGMDLNGMKSKKFIRAKQISERGGVVFCQYDESRVHISGHARLYMKGEILIP